MKAIALCFLILTSLHAPLCLAQTAPDTDYWERARKLLERSQRGESLSESEQSFLAEAKARRARAATGGNTGMQGDGATAPLKWAVPPVPVALDLSPILPLEITATDGRNSTIYWRKPQGEGPFPAILFIHGGLNEYPAESLRAHLTENPIITRFLAAGHAVVMATFRTYSQEIQSRGPILDGSAALDGMARHPSIDPGRIFVYGGSGGGSIALELASDERPSGVIACEPATVIYTGMLGTADYGVRLEMMREPERFFTKEVADRTLTKLKTIQAPVLIIHSDRHDLVRLNKPMILPLMREAGVNVDYREYPGYGHGFYWGGGGDRWGKAADPSVVEAVFADVLKFVTQAK